MEHFNFPRKILNIRNTLKLSCRISCSQSYERNSPKTFLNPTRFVVEVKYQR